MFLIRPSIKTTLVITNTLSNISSVQTRYIKRWVAPTLRELNKRAKKLPQEPVKRSSFIDWNYSSEIFAFSKRLQEEFKLPLLQTAFTQHSYVAQEKQRQRELEIEEADIQMEDNKNLSKQGAQIVTDYVQAYLKYSLPNVPDEGLKVFEDYLLSVPTLSHIGLNLGMKDLIFSAEYPPHEETVAQTLLAVIGALAESSGTERAYIFVRDFICTQMNQKDLMELWHIENPEEMLRTVCKQRKLPEPEPRLIGDCGQNTVLAAYNVGIYTNKEMIGKGFGEDIPTAIQTASLDALLTIFRIQDNMRPFDFDLKVEPKNPLHIAK